MLDQFFVMNRETVLEYIVIAMAVLILLLFILILVQIVQNRKLRKAYRAFMGGREAKSLEDNLIQRLRKIDELMELNNENTRRIEMISRDMDKAFQKIGLVKYNALDEVGGKRSFSLALLNNYNDGFIINVVHSRSGAYTYIKEIIKGNSVLVLAEEEQTALDSAIRFES